MSGSCKDAQTLFQGRHITCKNLRKLCYGNQSFAGPNVYLYDTYGQRI